MSFNFLDAAFYSPSFPWEVLSKGLLASFKVLKAEFLEDMEHQSAYHWYRKHFPPASAIQDAPGCRQESLVGQNIG